MEGVCLLERLCLYIHMYTIVSPNISINIYVNISSSLHNAITKKSNVTKSAVNLPTLDC